MPEPTPLGGHPYTCGSSCDMLTLQQAEIPVFSAEVTRNQGRSLRS